MLGGVSLKRQKAIAVNGYNDIYKNLHNALLAIRYQKETRAIICDQICIGPNDTGEKDVHVVAVALICREATETIHGLARRAQPTVVKLDELFSLGWQNISHTPGGVSRRR